MRKIIFDVNILPKRIIFVSICCFEIFFNNDVTAVLRVSEKVLIEKSLIVLIRLLLHLPTILGRLMAWQVDFVLMSLVHKVESYLGNCALKGSSSDGWDREEIYEEYDCVYALVGHRPFNSWRYPDASQATRKGV